MSTIEHHDTVDILVIAAHPDDAELSCGGTIRSAVLAGKRVAIVDCTRGELGSRGTPELRKTEADRAARVLGVQFRENLSLPDGKIDSSEAHVEAVVRTFRHYRPKILLFPPARDRHPDHEQTHNLVRRALFMSGLPKLKSMHNGQTQKPYRPGRTFCYMQTYEFEPAFYVDISAYYEDKIQAVQAYSSQFHVPGNTEFDDEPQTFISRPEFSGFLEARSRYFGAKIGVTYAEAFYSIEPIGIPNIQVFL